MVLQRTLRPSISAPLQVQAAPGLGTADATADRRAIAPALAATRRGSDAGETLVGANIGEYYSDTVGTGRHRRIEVLRVAEGNVRLDDDVIVSAAGADPSSPTGKRLTQRKQREAERAPALLEEAMRELEPLPKPGAPPAS